MLTFRIKQLQLTKITQNEFSTSLAKEQLSTAMLSYSPTFIIGLMSTWSADFGLCSRPLPAVQGCSASRSLPCSRQTGQNRRIVCNVFARAIMARSDGPYPWHETWPL